MPKKSWRSFLEVILVSREALINAAVHGAKLNYDKTVKFELRIEPAGLVMEIGILHKP
ncbi:hypothetical protein [Desulfosarcina sp. BuS5]|uniref:hypothetical protein n=1 Tax=Desulfosarcina sp. BuS5 TaxID=933262 RepID=UPI0012F7E33A|nr:hypothetical protein [Desulfosarcina sp. BuS5]